MTRALVRLLERFEFFNGIDIRKCRLLVVECDFHDVKRGVPFIDFALTAFQERLKVRGETGFDRKKSIQLGID